jgi:hypothetical protein
MQSMAFHEEIDISAEILLIETACLSKQSKLQDWLQTAGTAAAAAAGVWSWWPSNIITQESK